MKPMLEEISEAERQVLIALSFLAFQNRAADADALAETADFYFGMYRVDWRPAISALQGKSWLETSGDVYCLTPAGREAADAVRLANPRSRYFYDEFFTRAERSAAHARFCERVYGKNLCQHGMLDTAQLGRLIDVLDLKAGQNVLELGCGNGRAAEAISDATGAKVTGLDISRVGIRQALMRTADRRARLNFIQGDASLAEFGEAIYDVVVAVDVLTFIRDLDSLLQRLQRAARPGAVMAVFYSSWVADGEERSRLDANGTRLAETLRRQGLPYQAWDFTEAELNHWRLKRQAALDLQAAFEAEENTFLFNNRFLEADQHRRYVDAGAVSRTLYWISLRAE